MLSSIDTAAACAAKGDTQLNGDDGSGSMNVATSSFAISNSSVALSGRRYQLPRIGSAARNQWAGIGQIFSLPLSSLIHQWLRPVSSKLAAVLNISDQRTCSGFGSFRAISSG